MNQIRKDDRISGYDKHARRQGIVNILIEALGKDHPYIEQISACQKRTSGLDDYCKRRLLCDRCSAMRFRLLKGIFYLRYQRALKPFFTVVAKPKAPLKHGDEQSLAEAFEMQRFQLLKNFGSFLGGRELTWTDRQPKVGYFWPHTHVVAQEQGQWHVNAFKSNYSARVDIRSLPSKVEDIEAALWHHCKPLPISWFPEKIGNSNIVHLDKFSLTEPQRKTVVEIVGNLWPLNEEMNFDRLVFSGKFDLDVYKPDHPLRYLLQSYALEKRLHGLDKLESRAHFVRVTCYYYLTLLTGRNERQARDLIGLKDSETKNFRRWKNDDDMRKRAFCALASLKNESGSPKWVLPLGGTDQEKSVISTAIQLVEFSKIQSKLDIAKSSLERIMRKFNLNHRDARLFMNHLYN